MENPSTVFWTVAKAERLEQTRRSRRKEWEAGTWIGRFTASRVLSPGKWTKKMVILVERALKTTKMMLTGWSH